MSVKRIQVNIDKATQAPFELLTPTPDGERQTFLNNGGWLTEAARRKVEHEAMIIAVPVSKLGNYRVAATITSPVESRVELFANRREAVATGVSLEANVPQTFEYWVHLAPYGNQVGAEAIVDSKVYLSIVGKHTDQMVVQLDIATAAVPTIHVAGDSIVADDEAYLPYRPQFTWSGWGQHLGQFLEDVAVDDQAHNGMTTVCYRDDGHWQRILADCQAGDWVVMQFGHNDQKRTYLQPLSNYATNLRRFIAEVRAVDAIPILVTPLSRIPTQDANGNWFDTLLPFAQAMVAIGAELDVVVIDLHQEGFKQLRQIDQPTRYFMDAAHTNDYGADLIASWVLKLLPAQDRLRDWIKPELSEFKPQAQAALAKKLDNEQPVVKAAPLANTYSDMQSQPAPIQELVIEAMQRHLVDPCVGYFHPETPLSLGMALYAFAAVAQPFERRPYVADFVDVSAHEWLAPYVQAALDSGLWQPGDFDADVCRLQAAITGRQLMTMVVRNLLPSGERALSPSACEQKAKDLKLQWQGYESNRPVTRLKAYQTMIKMCQIKEA